MMSERARSAGRRGLARAVLFYAACFLAPIALLAAACALGGVFPFGPESFLTEDAKYQYVDLFAWLKRILAGEASAFYAAGIQLGMNAWGLMGYYLSSPFNLLVAFFDEDDLVAFLWLVTALKLGCIQVSCAWYLRRRFELPPGPAFALALGYACSAWTVTQMRNPMWLDALILLPIAAYALYRLVRDGRWKLMSVAVAGLIVTCWYMAYMSVLFLCLLALLELTAAYGAGLKLPPRAVAQRVGLFALAMAFALALSAFTFAPTVFVMLGGRANAAQAIADMTTVPGLAASFFVGNWTLDQVPQHFMGTLAAVLAAGFFFVRGVPARVKVAAALLLVFLVASSYAGPLMYVWCGLRMPTGFYCRMAFLTLFTMMWMAGSAVQGAFSRAGGGKRRWTPFALGAVVVVAGAAAVFANGWFAGGRNALVTVVLAVGYAALLAVLAKDAHGDDAARGAHARGGAVPLSVGALACSVALCGIVFAEMLYGAAAAFPQLYNSYPQDYHDAYVEDSEAQLSELRAMDDGLYRVDKTYTRVYEASLDEALARGYLALSSYASSQDGAALDMLHQLGYGHDYSFWMCYSQSLLVPDSLLGVKYVSSDSSPAQFADTGLPPVGATLKAGPATLYRNPYALPLGYGVSGDASGFAFGPGSGDNPFELQNSLVNALSGRDAHLYVPLSAKAVESSPDRAVYEVDVPAGLVGYVYVRTPDYGPVKLAVDGGSVAWENYEWRHALNALGEASSKQVTHTVEVERFMEGDRQDLQVEGLDISRDVELLAYGLDLGAFEGVASQLASHPCTFDTFRDGDIQATYQAPADGWMLLTVPAAKGWDVQVNGQPVEVSSVCDGALILIPVTEGENALSLKFTPPLLREGCAVSLAAAIILLALTLIPRIRRSPEPSALG